MMDAEWVGRAGILAEIVSIPLIAPEILGPERLGRLEDWLESLMSQLRTDVGTLPKPSFANFGRPMDDGQSGQPIEVATFLLLLLSMLPALAVMAIVAFALPAVLLYYTVSEAASVLFVLGLLASICFWGFSFQILYEEPNASRAWQIAGRLSMLPGMPGGWAMFLAIAVSYRFMHIVVRWGTTLLAGPDRVRALVFGTGALLLFGGLISQFVATF